MKKFVAAVTCLLALANAASAALIIHIPDIQVTESTSPITGSFDVYVEEVGAEENVQAYNVPLRLSVNPAFQATFTGVSASSSEHPSLFNGQVPADRTVNATGYVAGRDIYLTDEFPISGTAQNAPVDNESRNGLFSLSYTIPANTPAGTVFTITGDMNPALFGVFDASGTDVVATFENGSITVIPVPEPSAMALGLFALPLLARRRR